MIKMLNHILCIQKLETLSQIVELFLLSSLNLHPVGIPYLAVIPNHLEWSLNFPMTLLGPYMFDLVGK